MRVGGLLIGGSASLAVEAEERSAIVRLSGSLDRRPLIPSETSPLPHTCKVAIPKTHADVVTWVVAFGMLPVMRAAGRDRPRRTGFRVRRECAGRFRGTSFCNRRERGQLLPSDKEQSMAKGKNQRKETKKPKKDKK